MKKIHTPRDFCKETLEWFGLTGLASDNTLVKSTSQHVIRYIKKNGIYYDACRTKTDRLNIPRELSITLFEELYDYFWKKAKAVLGDKLERPNKSTFFSSGVDNAINNDEKLLELFKDNKLVDHSIKSDSILYLNSNGFDDASKVMLQALFGKFFTFDMDALVADLKEYEYLHSEKQYDERLYELAKKCGTYRDINKYIKNYVHMKPVRFTQEGETLLDDVYSSMDMIMTELKNVQKEIDKLRKAIKTLSEEEYDL